MSEVEEKRANPPFGRKVFFVNPSFKVQSKIITALREEEYEVYIIRKWRDVKNYLVKNPDSVCFISVDGQMSVQAWMAMVDSFAQHDVLSTTISGFLTENALKKAAIVAFNTKLPAGYNSTAGEEEEVLRTLKNILEVHGAKGRRQYVRCSCFKENAYVYLTVTDAGGNPSMFQMKIVDISTATVAVEVPDIFKGRLKIRQWLQNAVVALNGRQVDTSLQVFLLKKTDKGTEIAILAYHSSMSKESKNYIRTFIFDTLQKEMERSINGMAEDKTDYNLEANTVLVLPSKDDDAKSKKGGKAEESDETASSGETAAADEADGPAVEESPSDGEGADEAAGQTEEKA